MSFLKAFQCRAFYVLLVLLTSCKPVSVTNSEKIIGAKSKEPMSGFYATSQTEVRAKNNFFYAVFKKDYELKFDSLPTQGEVAPDKVPYVGSWYPQTKGGTNVKLRGTSALEKYDAVFNATASTKASEWERQNHTVTTNDASTNWAGHCNGFSASATRHSEPKRPVTRGQTTFAPEDIKALMAEIHMGAKFYFLGGNRCGLIEQAPLMPPGSRQDLMTMGICDDVNPGTFHVAVANWIGIKKYPIIADVNGKEQVWNYPHWKYSINSRVVTKEEANQIITGSRSQTYQFNPQAKNFRSVAMSITKTEAVVDEVITSQIPASQRAKVDNHFYVLELNDAGEIIGGEWVSTSQKDHPDFIWVALEPMPGDGTPYSSNPYLDPKEVLKIWSESIGSDPVPLAIMEPGDLTGWGKFPKFDIWLNGSQTGSVFAIENTVEVSLKPKEGLAGAKAEGWLDGNPISFDQSAQPKAIVSKPTPGVHVLELKWVASGKVMDEQRARIHIVR